MVMELIPIGTILAVLTNQVLKTAAAARDILIEKESFKVLSKHLFDIEPVLKELQLQELNDSQTARLALESLEADVKKANNLVEKYTNRSRFYLLLRCRLIVHEVEEVTRDIGRSLSSLSLANTEVLSRIFDQVNRLQDEMQRVELEASHSQLQIVDKLNQGIRDQKLDQAFANIMLEEIASAVGIPVEPSAICKELASFRKEKEEAAYSKERAEVLFLEQVIELLSQADAARDYEEVKRQYMERSHAIERYDSRDALIPPLNTFICCLNRTVMVDPVNLCTGTTCERAAIESWFDSGKRTDPKTEETLEDTTLRSNLPLRQSIQEWKELNYCLMIRSCKENLLSGNDSSVEPALTKMEELVRENSVNKDWISIGGLTDILIPILESSSNKDCKRKILITLNNLVQGHRRNKEKVIESEGWYHVIRCLKSTSTSKAAIDLLFELLQDRSGWNESVCRKLSQKRSAILFLVTLLNGPVKESAEIAEKILVELFAVNEESISLAAKSGYYKPLIARIVQGPDASRKSMVKAIVDMEWVDLNLKLLGEEGAIPPLLEMLSHQKIETKELSLSALVKLAGSRANKEIIASSGGVPIVLNLLFSTQVRTVILIKCYEILEKLSYNDGVRFFVDEEGKQIELEPIIAHLLTVLKNPNSVLNIRKPALRSLLGICKFDEAGLVEKAVLAANGVAPVLSLLDDSDSEVREAAIILLFLFSQHEPEGIVEYLLKPRRLEALVGFLENKNDNEVQMAAAGLLANLPKSERELTKKLIEQNGLDAILNILKSGTKEAKENALSALFRFADPTDMESQHVLVEKGAYPLLVDFLTTDSITAKARAAALIGNLSMSTPNLSAVPQPACCWCFRSPNIRLCPIHGGICSVTTTFCLLEGNALPSLLRLLHGEVHATVYEAIQALSTLFFEGSIEMGANILHEANAIKPILDVLDWGTDPLKEEALRLLEKVFVSKEMVDHYGKAARMFLVCMAGRNIHEDGQVRMKAAKVLQLLERYSKSSTSLFSGGLG